MSERRIATCHMLGFGGVWLPGLYFHTVIGSKNKFLECQYDTVTLCLHLDAIYVVSIPIAMPRHQLISPLTIFQAARYDN